MTDVITMASFNKEDLQSTVDAIKDALKEEFEDGTVHEELKEARRLLVAAIKYARGKGVILLTLGECVFLSRVIQEAARDPFVHSDVALGLQELLVMFKYRGVARQKVAI